jgi:hypothetical protein
LSILLAASGAEANPRSDTYFAIEVVDSQTGRGVPMVELQTTFGSTYDTDSNGLIAFYEPGLMNHTVWFGVSSHGYEFPRDGLGMQGVKLVPRAGESAQIQIKRLNIAERLYRITGYGIYRDTELLGRKPPVDEPLLNAEVAGQDGVLNAVYHGKLYWFYGDTTRLSYALGNFAMSGAITAPPDRLDPSVGFKLDYFTGTDGFARRMSPLPGEGVVWLTGLTVLPDPTGTGRMLAYFQRRRGLGAVLENGFVVFNEHTQTFEKLQDVPLNPQVYPQLYSFPVQRDGTNYLYFNIPYPVLRVKADWSSYLDLSSYEVYTCLKAGSTADNKDKLEFDRDPHGELIWSWKINAAPLTPKDQQELIAAGRLKPDECPFRLQDVESGKPILLSDCSCFWNAFRQRYIMIASEAFGATMLGEIWFSESGRPEGPWGKARKIITHANKKGDAHDFYNPTQHPFFDQDGGRIIYLEGAYVNTFSGNPHPTPYYEYNQIMYRLDLADPRLRLE